MTLENLTSYFQNQIDMGSDGFRYELETGSSESDNGIVYLTHYNTLEKFLDTAKTFDYIGIINDVPRFKVRLAPSE